MTDENNNADEYFQNLLQEHGLPPDTTRGQYMWHATKRALIRTAWAMLIMAGFIAVVLWKFAPDLLIQLVGVPIVALRIVWPFLTVIGFGYIGYLIVKALQKAARD